VMYPICIDVGTFVMCQQIIVWKIYILIYMLLLQFQNRIFFSVCVTFPVRVPAFGQKIFFCEFTRPTEKYMFSLCNWLLFPVRVILFFCVDMRTED